MQKNHAIWLFFFAALLLISASAFSQSIQRPDVIWARTSDAPITLDGVLNETAWAKAESIHVQYGMMGDQIPGSGSRSEGGVEPSDPLDATLKFLVDGNDLYIAATVKDSSVGGGLFNRFDGFLINIRNAADANRPAGSFEYFYGWVTEGWADPNTGLVGAAPGFFGWAAGDRTVWDAMTVVNGVSNSDTTADVGYTVEFKFNLESRGYDATAAEGTIIPLNISIYDADWQWPYDEAKFSGNRTWVQGPWSNASVYNVLRVYTRPDVSVASGGAPYVGPDVIIPNADTHPLPVIDGKLDEAVWAAAPSLDLRYGDDELRNSYGGVGPLMSGQWQPEINSVKAPVLDPADATIKWFFREDVLYLGVDVRDQAVWSLPSYDQWDGIRFIINDMGARDEFEGNMLRREFTLRFDESGKILYQDYFTTVIDSMHMGQAEVTMKPGTTVNNYNDIDAGYYFEAAIDLKALGYKHGLSEGNLFISATLFDGDSFLNAADDYGNRVWWMREAGGNAGPAWGYLDPYTTLPGGTIAANERPDAVWARTSAAAITLDGKLDEAAWGKAESVRLRYGRNGVLIPGSGSRREVGADPSDPLDATLKFLVNGNKLYMAAIVNDASVGGGLFNMFDGFLMNIRNRAVVDRPVPVFEYFYGWVTEGWADPNTGLVGAAPGFFGWAAGDRTVWDAVTVVNGVSNSDTTLDNGYTTEFMFDLAARGYDVTKAGGDIIEFNISIYDADWQWPYDDAKFSGNRTWWQGPWSNANTYDIARIYARPDVTVDTPALPVIGPDIVIPNGVDYASPTVDGNLDESVWANIKGMDLRYGDDELRNSYPGIGAWRSGQWQPEIDSKRAPVLDPADATLKWFFKDNWLYIAADVRDQAVWSLPAYDQWDGLRIIINDRAARDDFEDNLLRRNFTMRFDQNGVICEDYLKTLVDAGKAYAGFMLKPGSTMNDYNDIDTGYNFEMGIDLAALGYPAGLGDGVLFISATLFDGDNFPNAADNYGNRVWWMREADGNAGPAWAFMDPNTKVKTGVKINPDSMLPQEFALIGNYPNPFNPSTTIRFAMPEEALVTLKVYDLLGRMLIEKALGRQAAGIQEVSFDAARIGSGVYFYRLETVSAKEHKTLRTNVHKMLVIK